MLFGAKMVLCAAAGRLAAERSELNSEKKKLFSRILKLTPVAI
jgi:hypothetical protein